VVYAGRPYLAALARAGAEPVVLAPRPLDEAEAKELLARFDGLLLLGGPDVDPARYGQERHPEVYGVDEEADGFEAALVLAAHAIGLPVLAICRGCQVVNVAFGGTLHQHLPDLEGVAVHGVFPQPGQPLPVGELHVAHVDAGSRLAEALGTTEPVGSSVHHQAVDRVGDGLRVVARADDGIIEGLEHTDGWLVAVQWHPEDTADADPTQQRLFDAFVARCRT